MTVIRHRPVLLNITGAGSCTSCGAPAIQLYPILVDGLEVVLCSECRRRRGL